MLGGGLCFGSKTTADECKVLLIAGIYIYIYITLVPTQNFDLRYHPSAVTQHESSGTSHLMYHPASQVFLSLIHIKSRCDAASKPKKVVHQWECHLLCDVELCELCSLSSRWCPNTGRRGCKPKHDADCAEQKVEPVWID